MAVISLSAARRLNPIRMPTSTPAGIVIVKARGRLRPTTSSTLPNGCAVAHHQFKNVAEIFCEENERENGCADGGVRHNFA